MNCAGVDWATAKHDVLVANERASRCWRPASSTARLGCGRLCAALVRLRGGAGRGRASGWAAGRAAARCRVERARVASQPGQGGAATLSGSGRQVRSLRRVRAVRARADRCHRFRRLEPDGDETKALRALTRAREDLVHAGSRWPTSCAASSSASGRARSDLLRDRQPDRAGVSGALSEPARRARARPPTPGRVPGAPALLRRPQPDAAAGAAARRALRARRRGRDPRAPRRSCSRWSPRCARSSSRSRSSRAQIGDAVRAHPDGPIFLSFFRNPESVVCAAILLAEIGDCRARYPPPTRSPPTAARPRSRSSPANASTPASGAPATNAFATRSTPWPTAPATGTPGPPTATPPRAPAATITRAPSARSAAPGAASLWRCWQDHAPYDPARHRGLQEHIAVTHSHRVEPPARPPRHPADARRRRHPPGGPQGRARSA